MARPILNSTIKVDQTLLTRTVSNTKIELTGLALDKRLREKRSLAYMEAIARLDAQGATCDHTMIEELINAIKTEFPELTPHQFPIGIISRCYLGDPYEVHSLDVQLEILQHYEKGQVLPAGMEKARSLALHPSYDFIEVFSDSMNAVSDSGKVSIIKG